MLKDVRTNDGKTHATTLKHLERSEECGVPRGEHQRVKGDICIVYARGPRGRFWSELITGGTTPTSEKFSHLAEGMSTVLLVALGSEGNFVVGVCLSRDYRYTDTRIRPYYPLAQTGSQRGRLPACSPSYARFGFA